MAHGRKATISNCIIIVTNNLDQSRKLSRARCCTRPDIGYAKYTYTNVDAPKNGGMKSTTAF